MKKVITLTIVSLVVLFSLIGCKKAKVSLKNLVCDEVMYNPTGEYETNVMADNLKELEKKDVEIYYPTFKGSEGILKQAEIKKVVKNNSGFSVLFKVSEDLAPSKFILKVQDLQTEVKVNLLETSLKAKNKLKKDVFNQTLVLEVEGGKLEGDLSKKDVLLEGRFKNLVVTDLLVDENEIKLELTGEVLNSDSLHNLVYGFVTLNNLKIDNETMSLKTKVEVVFEELSVLNDSFNFKDGFLEFDLLVNNYLNEETLDLTMFSFNKDISVQSFKLHDDKLSLKVMLKEANDLESALKLLKNTELKIGDLKVTFTLDEVSFYPVFDYLEETSNGFKLTLKLLALNGKFKDVKKADISLENDFKDGKVLNIEKENNEVLILELLLPLKGETEESFSRDGKIVLNGNALENNFKLKANNKEYERNYALTNLGKDDPFKELHNYEDKLAGFRNPHLYKALTEARGASIENGNLILSILSLTGLVKTSEMLFQNQMRAFYDDVMLQLSEQTRLLKQINLNVDVSRFDSFNQNLNSLTTATSVLMSYIKDNALANNLTLPTETTSEEDVLIFVNELNNKGITTSQRFNTLFYNLDELFVKCASQISEKFNITSPFTIYDSITSQIYNFSTSSIPSKLAYAATLSSAIYQAYGALRFASECKDKPSDFEVNKANFNSAMTAIESYYEDLKETQKEYLDPTKTKTLYLNTYGEEIENHMHEVVNIFDQSFMYCPNTHHYDGKTSLSYLGAPFKDRVKTYDFLEKMGGRTLEEELNLAMIYYSDPVIVNGKVKYDNEGRPVMQKVEPFALLMYTDDSKDPEDFYLNFNDNKLVNEKTIIGFENVPNSFTVRVIVKPQKSFFGTRMLHSYK